MSNVVRWTLSTARDLYVSGAGAFKSGVLDIDANNLAAVTRARYLVQPYRAIEVGIVNSNTPYPTLPASPTSPNPDPYPQYVTDADLANPTSAPVVSLRSFFGRLPATSDKTYYVSVNGSDSNDGLSWGSALRNLNAALPKLGFGPGTIEMGAGVFSSTGIVPNYGQVIRGRGRYATIIELSATGTLIELSGVSNVRFESLGLQFASTSVTGTLAKMANTFTCDFVDVQFLGRSRTAGQVGVALTANAGDSRFTSCFFDALDVGVQSDSTVNYLIGCVLTGNRVGAQGGDPTGAVAASGLVCTDTVFRGVGDYYVNILGSAQAWHFKGCWFDSAATTAVQVGAGVYGPWLFTMTDIPYLAGATKSLVLNASLRTKLSGVVFGNSGSNPTDLTIVAANCKRGSVDDTIALQGTKIETLVPPKWQGAVGYAQNADGSVSLVETYSDMDVASGSLTRRRIVIRVVNRTSGSTADTVTFPSAFETTFAGGQFAKIFDNTGIGAGLTFNATSITFPAGVAAASGVVILEGF